MKPLDLRDHPEGGRFREVFRSAKAVSTQDGRTRPALTHIYFSLRQGEVSKFHKVTSDEVWNLYQGSGIILYTWDGSHRPPQRIVLSASDHSFCYVIPADTWQAAEPLSGTVLVGCSVAPGFEFSDFELIDPDSKQAGRLIALEPLMTRFITS